MFLVGSLKGSLQVPFQASPEGSDDLLFKVSLQGLPLRGYFTRFGFWALVLLVLGFGFWV